MNMWLLIYAAVFCSLWIFIYLSLMYISCNLHFIDNTWLCLWLLAGIVTFLHLLFNVKLSKYMLNIKMISMIKITAPIFIMSHSQVLRVGSSEDVFSK